MNETLRLRPKHRRHADTPPPARHTPIYFHPDTFERLRSLAGARGLTMPQLVRRIVEGWIAERDLYGP